MGNDLRLAWRGLAADRGFTLIAVLLLALGLGANTAIFSVVQAALLHELPYEDPERLDFLWEDATAFGFPKNTPSPATFLQWQQRARSFSAVAAMEGRSFNLTGGGEPERLDGYRVTGDFFSLLGIRPAAGRLLGTADDRPGVQHAVLSHGLWERRFGADRTVIGRTVSIDGAPWTVVGVLPRGFRFPGDAADLFLPMGWTPEQRASQSHFLVVIGRRQAGVSERAGNAEMVALGRQMERENPADLTNLGAFTASFREELSGRARPGLLLLLATVGLLLLIACSNVAGLLLARAARRRRETAVRVALGAGRWRLLRQNLAESVLLALAGGAAGLLLAHWTLRALQPLLPESLFLAMELRIDGTVLLFGLAAALGTGLLFGLAPALASWHTAPYDALKEGARGTSSGFRARGVLVAAQAALSLVLLIGAGLILKSFTRLTATDPGFRSDHRLTLQLTLPMPKYADDTRRAAFYGEILDRVRALPGVTAAGAISRFPLSSEGGANGIYFEGRPLPQAGEMPVVNVRDVSAGYFATMGARLLRGRGLSPRDRAGAPLVAVINDAMARRFWPGQDALGRRFRTASSEATPWVTVVGVLADIRQNTLAEPAVPEIYYPVDQAANPTLRDFVVRTREEPLALANAVRRAIWSLDPDLPISGVRTVDDVVAMDVAAERLQSVLLGTFAVLALLLAAAGIYGVVSYAVVQRTRELGIRAALGAGAPNLLRLVLRQGLRPVLLGLAAGFAAALAASRLLASLLHGVEPRDPAVFALGSLVLLAAALFASLLPAARASRTDPLVALRAEG